jgi:hypothetical protein
MRPETAKASVGDLASGVWVHRWARNACQNYQTVMAGEGIRFLNDACLGLPAFVCGVGPSLDDIIPELKQAEKRAILIATDAAFRPLLANQIRPDLVISFDCKAEQSTLWESAPDHGIPALFDSCAHPSAYRSWKGPVLFYNHWHQQDQFSANLLPYIFPNIGQLPSAGTVGNMGLLAARLMGCNPVYAVGMDFCYRQIEGGWRYRAIDYRIVNDGEGQHWRETENKVLYNNDERVARTFDLEVGGKKFKTDPELSHYYEACIRVCKEYKVNLMNVSPGSMLADQVPFSTLESALDTYARFPIMGGRHILPFLDKILGRVR